MEYKIIDVANLLGCEIKGDKNLLVKGLAPFFQAKEDELTFASDEKFLHKLGETKAKVIIVPNIDLPEIGKTYLLAKDDPRKLMPLLLNYFKRKTKKMIKPTEDSAKIGNNVEIAPHVYIGHDVIIGDNCKIYPNVTICEGVKLGKDCIIYPNVTIREFCEIGDRVILQPGVVIGGDGYGFVKVNGNNIKIEQIGKVIIEDDVEIGANTTIDRGTIGDTIIKQYSKLDNLIQIAHNVIIGKNFLAASQVGIAGSTEVGDNVTFGGQVGVGGHIKIANNVTVAAKGGITGNITEENQVLGGYPLMPLKDDLKVKATIKKLPELMKKIKTLEKELEKLNK
ncbi:UDP-3-O-(3-hydroxymyristoyl)glucosamine N-acyltransferase [Fusobacterium perfoetens]|uniref:UDP-3-O-(3-hydroxymyristoyl)glucosamine N-acyltransferase n=1 Tax=Fusobacterium perfoetens TaxID=852 RepID=UPI000489F606|nr:UDP-3-O-(3-hydroxymyristoyl)glucosamine N-acyltransferase [Fusobacterium perfoetens]MCI6153413.1 UDP-3-O-(3-hydroxymyristoyl)glucosamine N-acyltransferase [Fusobacterium perfoetens]MDY3238444.1 UDP-3-O-(3-hydroxymyristoyl)glucosamine N-acyltransferase [Fusobacterium perfoetens]